MAFIGLLCAFCTAALNHEELCRVENISALTRLTIAPGAKARSNFVPTQHEITTPKHSAVSEACGPLLEARAVIWVSGPQGSGKSTIGLRASEYGFMTMDCEDSWLALFATNVPKSAAGEHAHFTIAERLMALTEATRWSQQYAKGAMVFPACYPMFLAEAPPHVLRVLLLPRPEVYVARWQMRNPADAQSHDFWYNQSVSLWQHDRGASMVRVSDEPGSCPDSSLVEMCSGLIELIQRRSTELCHHCSRSTETSTFYARFNCRARCPPSGSGNL